MPLAVVGECLADRPCADVNDHPGFLEQGNESARRDKPEIGALPAHQSFDSENASGLDVDLRLIMEDELVFLQRIAQLVLEGKPPRNALGHLLVIEQVSFPGRFRSHERGLGVLEQRVRVCTVAGKHRDAELGGDPDLMLAHPIR